VRQFIQLRELPDRLWGALGGRSGLQTRAAFGLHNFKPLGRNGDQEVAISLVGEFWQADYSQTPIADAETFTQFTEPGIAQLILNSSTEATGDDTTWLRTETRVFCNNPASLLRFTPYWWLIRPVSGLIRIRLLARIRDAAHAG
jgi:hypothetical protein